MLDVLIRGGSVVDGSGGARVPTDVAIAGDRIVRVGNVDEPAARTIDARGKVVCPGFIDVHTHLDAQPFWDPHLAPSSLHGVTTVFAGNCGFTIAPLSGDPADADYVMHLLSRVEGLPAQTLRQAVPWSWRSTGDYFDAMDGNLGINAGFMVGHSTLRRMVVGAAANERVASDEEIRRMGSLLADGLAAGAMGLSSSRGRSHNDAEGRKAP